MRVAKILILLVAVFLLGPARADFLGDFVGALGINAPTLPQVTTPTCKTYWIEWPALSSSDSTSVANFYSAVYASLGWWEQRGGNVRFVQATDSGRADVVIQVLKASPDPSTWVGRYSPVSGGPDLIEVALGGIYDYGIATTEWKPFSQVAVWRITSHEIGHFLGFGHSSDMSNVMYPMDSPQVIGQIADLFGDRGTKLGVTPIDGGFKERLGGTPCSTSAQPAPTVLNTAILPTAAPQPTSAQTPSSEAGGTGTLTISQGGECISGVTYAMGQNVQLCYQGRWVEYLTCPVGSIVDVIGANFTCLRTMAGLIGGWPCPVPVVPPADYKPPPSPCVISIPTPAKSPGFEGSSAVAVLLAVALLSRRLPLKPEKGPGK